MKEQKRSLIVDGDIVLFKIGRTTEDISDFGDMVCESFDQESAIRALEHELDVISKKTGYAREEIIFSISDDTNFRKEFFPTYKGNRKHIRKPLGLKAMREYLRNNKVRYQVLEFPKCEADDVMGYYGSIAPEVIAIYSQDKDLFTIPCKQWCFKKDKFIYPKPLESFRFLCTQVLIGDPVDGYGGLPRCGKVKAAKAFMNCKNELELFKAVHQLYYEKYKEDAKKELLIQAGQARILHYMDYERLVNDNVTYNPYDELGVTDEMQRMWEEERDLELSKRVRKKSTRSTSNKEKS